MEEQTPVLLRDYELSTPAQLSPGISSMLLELQWELVYQCNLGRVLMLPIMTLTLAKCKIQ